MALEVALREHDLGQLSAEAVERGARLAFRLEGGACLDGTQRAAALEREPRAQRPARPGPLVARIENVGSLAGPPRFAQSRGARNRGPTVG